MKPTYRIAVGLVWQHGRLVVGHRSIDQTYAGLAEFPGGKCEPGEEPEAAVIREVAEETGLATRLIALRQKVDFETESVILQLHFFDLEPPFEHSEPLLPFEWWSVERVLAGSFPPANQPVLDSIRRRPGPICLDDEASTT
jgi:mutator protein MutT